MALELVVVVVERGTAAAFVEVAGPAASASAAAAGLRPRPFARSNFRELSRETDPPNLVVGRTQLVAVVEREQVDQQEPERAVEHWNSYSEEAAAAELADTDTPQLVSRWFWDRSTRGVKVVHDGPE